MADDNVWLKGKPYEMIATDTLLTPDFVQDIYTAHGFYHYYSLNREEEEGVGFEWLHYFRAVDMLQDAKIPEKLFLVTTTDLPMSDYQLGLMFTDRGWVHTCTVRDRRPAARTAPWAQYFVSPLLLSRINKH